MGESRILIDWEEQGDESYDMEVVGYRNFKQYFSEAFYSIEKPLSVLSVSDSSIHGEVARGFRRKRLRPGMQTFARAVANVCGKGCKRLRPKQEKTAWKSTNRPWTDMDRGKTFPGTYYWESAYSSLPHR